MRTLSLCCSYHTHTHFSVVYYMGNVFLNDPILHPSVYSNCSECPVLLLCKT